MLTPVKPNGQTVCSAIRLCMSKHCFAFAFLGPCFSKDVSNLCFDCCVMQPAGSVPLRAAPCERARGWHCAEHDHEDEDEEEDDDELEDADLAVLAKHGLTREDFHNLVRLACKLVPLLPG